MLLCDTMMDFFFFYLMSFECNNWVLLSIEQRATIIKIIIIIANHRNHQFCEIRARSIYLYVYLLTCTRYIIEIFCNAISHRTNFNEYASITHQSLTSEPVKSICGFANLTTIWKVSVSLVAFVRTIKHVSIIIYVSSSEEEEDA